MPYAGPQHDESLAIELHNTVYAGGGERRDGLATQASADAWLAVVAAGTPRVPRSALIGLRDDVRALLAAVVAGDPLPRAAVGRLNAASARRPQHVVLDPDTGEAGVADAAATARERLLGAIAADALELAGGPRRDALHLCGAPGCVLLYERTHPRRGWCSATCGNRARQARHYARHRG